MNLSHIEDPRNRLYYKDSQLNDYLEKAIVIPSMYIYIKYKRNDADSKLIKFIYIIS